jgi:hypothetical protein
MKTESLPVDTSPIEWHLLISSCMVALSMDMLRSESEPMWFSRILGTTITGSDGLLILPSIWARTISILVTHSGLRYVGVSLYSVGR